MIFLAILHLNNKEHKGITILYVLRLKLHSYQKHCYAKFNSSFPFPLLNYSRREIKKTTHTHGKTVCMQEIIQSSHCQEEPTMSAHCARIPAHARPLAPLKVMMCSVWSDWPWPQWPWRAGDVARAAPPSPWSGPAVCGSPRCHHSPPRSGPLPPPVNKPHGQHLDLLVVVYTAFKGNAQCTQIKWKIHTVTMRHTGHKQKEHLLFN